MSDDEGFPGHDKQSDPTFEDFHPQGLVSSLDWPPSVDTCRSSCFQIQPRILRQVDFGVCMVSVVLASLLDRP